jgi:DNA-binding response OmpR family regulator
MCVLLVEHYLPLARALQRGLEEEGIPTDLAQDDKEGEARLRSGCYRAVVVNWRIPQRGGAALVRRWRRDGLAAPVLLLVPSANGAAQGADAGADAYLPLPFAFADLLARLRAWISGEPADRPLPNGSSSPTIAILPR